MRVCELMQSKMLVDIVDRALVKLRAYPGNGVVYFEILSKQYIYKNRYTESELLDELCMERSVFYDRKREAVQLFSVCLFGYTLPELQGEALPACSLCDRKPAQRPMRVSRSGSTCASSRLRSPWPPSAHHCRQDG